MNADNHGFEISQVSEWFWNIINQASRSRENLRNFLSTMEKEELIRFEDEFLEASAQLNDDPYLQYTDPDESEDGVEDIINWVVSQGKDLYTKILNNPQLIPKEIDNSHNLHGVAGEVYWEKFGEEIQNHLR